MGPKQHWWALRLASLPLIPLFFYFLLQDGMFTHDRASFIAWAGQPLTGGLLILFIACAFYHAVLGMEEIIIDYVSGTALKASLLFNKIIFAALGIACVYAIVTFMGNH